MKWVIKSGNLRSEGHPFGAEIFGGEGCPALTNKDPQRGAGLSLQLILGVPTFKFCIFQYSFERGEEQ